MNTHDPKYKHKPSEKHTLEEVLKSLQDMIRNDLRDSEQTVAPAEKSRPATAATAETRRREPAPPVREDFAPTSPAAGPVNLAAVVRSLNDLISNELNVGDPPVAEQSTPPPARQKAAEENVRGEFTLAEMEHISKEPVPPPPDPHADEEIVAEELAPLEEEPVFEEPDKLGVDIASIVGKDIVAADETAAPAPVQHVAEKNISEGLTPLEAVPVFEAPAEPGIGEEFAPPVESPPVQKAEEEIVFVGIKPPEAGSIFEEPIELSLDQELAPLEATTPPLRPGEASVSEKFEPLDEELTFDESTEIISAPATEPATPEFPGEINPEMLDTPEAATSSAAPVLELELEKKPAPGLQQEFSLDELSLTAIEPVVSSRNLTYAAAPPQMLAPRSPAETLPTIEVEESFDEMAYREAESLPGQTRSSEKQEIQEIIATALAPPTEPGPIPPAVTSAAGDEKTLTPNPTPGPELESITAPAKKKIKLEVVDGPLMPDSPGVPPVDFDFASLVSPGEPDAVIETTAAPAPATETPLTAEKIQSQATAVESETIALEPPPAEPAPPSVKLEARAPESEPPKLAKELPAAGNQATAPAKPKKGQTPPATDTTQPTAAPPASAAKPGGKPPTLELDDIPVLNEVVAPPVGSSLVADTASTPPAPPLPTPDRARDIVVRAVAKLNIEMRQAGGTGLDTKTILRLQKLIRQELEKNSSK
ncbi:MAG: hypothetical protein Q7J84_17595 [Sulfuricaulis sp.]|nr:hypothetical protein [Sulfuricaulis sp.]